MMQTYPVAGLLRFWLEREGWKNLSEGSLVKADDVAVAQFYEEAAVLHPEFDDSKRKAWALFCAITHPTFNPKQPAPTKVEDLDRKWLWIWRIAVIVALFLIFGALVARAQGTSQIDVIQFQDNSGTPIATYAAPFNIKCLANLTCTPSGSTMSINSSGGGGTGCVPPGGAGDLLYDDGAGGCANVAKITWTNGTSTLLAASGLHFDFTSATDFKFKVGTGSTLTANGATGQVLESNGDGTFTPADPLVSYNYVTLINAGAATGSITSSAVRSSTLGSWGMMFVSFASITGSPSTCSIQLSALDSAGNVIVTMGTYSLSNPGAGNSVQKFSVTPSGALTTDQVKAAFSCSGGYASGGTVSVDFVPAVPTYGHSILSDAGGNEVLVNGFTDGNSLSTYTVDSNGDQNGISGKPYYVTGSGGTFPVTGTFWQSTQPVSCANAVTCPVNASQVTSPWIVAGGGTAGTAATGVVTVQGIASMTKLLVTPDSVALPSHQSVNVDQLNGTTTDTNSGTKSAGTLRVVLATDQPALTNKLLVTPDSVALPAHQSTNVDQLNGTTTDTNSGTKSAGTLRVVLATDQPQLTNKLLVTPDSVALPAHQSTNVDQLNGTTTDTNSGTKSAGTLRVVLATDQPQLTNKLLVTPDANSAINLAQVNGHTATECGVNGCQSVGGNIADGSALSSQNDPIVIAGKGTGNVRVPIVCDSSGLYDASTNGKTQLVALTSGQVIYVCSIVLSQSTSTTTTVSIGSGTGTNCGTTYTAKTPAWPIQAPASVGPIGISNTAPFGAALFQTAASEELCISTNAAVSVQLLYTYTKF